MKITIRRAVAGDASFLAWVMLTASRSHCRYGLWEHFVNGNEQDCLSFLENITVTPARHLFHYEVFILAEKNGCPVAALSGYDPTTNGLKAFSRDLSETHEDMGWSKSELNEAFGRLRSYSACMPVEAPGVWIVESVAAVPEVRRQGIVTLLLNQILEQGRGQGFTQAQIAVLPNNTAARGAYEKCGFGYVDEKRDPDFEATYGDVGIARLMMDL